MNLRLKTIILTLLLTISSFSYAEWKIHHVEAFNIWQVSDGIFSIDYKNEKSAKKALRAIKKAEKKDKENK